MPEPTTDEALSGSNTSTPDSSIKPPVHDKRTTAGFILITDTQLSISRIDYLKKMYPSAIIETVNNKQDLIAVMKKYKSIDRLVIFNHGSAVSMAFTDANGKTSYIDLETFAELAESSEPQFAKVRILDLEGCNNGKSILNMLRIRRSLDAEKVSGTNFYHIIFPLFYDGKNDADMTLRYNDYVDYFIPGTPTLEKVLQSEPYPTLYYEAFVNDAPDKMSQMPLSSELANRERTFKSKSDAEPLIVRNEEEAEKEDFHIGFSSQFFKVEIVK